MPKTEKSRGSNINTFLEDMETNVPNNQLKEEKMVTSKEERMGIRGDKRPSVFIINIVVLLN